MRVIDVQVHVYEHNHPGRPWAGRMHGPDSASGPEMVAAMDKAGVDAAVIVSSYSMYRFDPSYAMQVYAADPERFRVVKPVDVTRAGLEEDVAEWARRKGTVGIRVMLRDELASNPADPRVSAPFAAAARHGLPVNFLCWGRLDDGAEVIRRNPDTVIVIDHLGLPQTNHPPVLEKPWEDLPKLLALARYPNVRVKISGACTLSREGYPYNDIWEPVLRVIDAFGIDRCMWGTDWTRTIGMLSYEQGTKPFLESTRLSDGDKAKLMGGTLEKVYNWNKW